MYETSDSGENQSTLSSTSEIKKESNHSTASKKAKKKQKGKDEANAGLGAAVCLTHSEKKRRRDRRGQRAKFKSKGESIAINETDPSDAVPRRKKIKKKTATSESTCPSTSSSTYEIEYQLHSPKPSGFEVDVDVVDSLDDDPTPRVWTRCSSHDRRGRKKPKKPEPASAASSIRSLPRKSSSAREARPVPDSRPSGPLSRRKLKFSSSSANADRSLPKKKSSERKTKKEAASKTKSTSKTAKKRKAKRCHGEPIGLDAELTDMKEDVIMASEAGGPVDGNLLAEQFTKSKPTNKLYMEHAGGFSVEKKSRIERQRMQMAAADLEPAAYIAAPRSTMSFALGTQHVFMSFSLFCQGLFAGAAFLHIIVVTHFYAQGGSVLLLQYGPMALHIQSFYYLLFALCGVAAFDRYDVHRPSRQCTLNSLTLQSGALSTICYFCGVIIHLVAAKTDDRIGLTIPYSNASYVELWPEAEERDKTLALWRILSTTRGVAAILGWLLTAISPQADRLSAHLEDNKALMKEEYNGSPRHSDDV